MATHAQLETKITTPKTQTFAKTAKKRDFMNGDTAMVHRWPMPNNKTTLRVIDALLESAIPFNVEFKGYSATLCVEFGPYSQKTHTINFINQTIRGAQDDNKENI